MYCLRQGLPRLLFGAAHAMMDKTGKRTHTGWNMDIPAFLHERLLAQYGEQTAQRILRGYAAKRRTTLRVNTLKSDVRRVCDQLRTAGLAFESAPWCDGALILGHAQEEAVQALPLYERGEVYVQSLSSMLPPILLGAQAGENVLDMAAAPGGKTTQIAALTGGGAMITACERSKPRAERLRFNLERQGASRVTVMNMDARQLDDLFSFDRILLDAPCSGSGTFCAQESGRARFSRELLAKNAKTQRELLAKALRLLRPGSEMIYSTCSVLEEENERVVMQAVKSGAAELVPIDAARFGDALPLLPTRAEGTMLVCPDELYEGFFVARLRRPVSGTRKRSK